MKHIFTRLAVLSFFAFAALSCRKEERQENRRQVEPAQTVQATLTAGQTYVLNMTAGSTVSIDKQAMHYQLSEVATALDGITAYRYAATKDYTGPDEVTLQQMVTSTSTGSGGCSGSQAEEHTTTSIKTIVIKFNVAN